MENWWVGVGFVFAILVPLGGLIVTLYKWQNTLNKNAHDQIGQNINRVEGKVDDGFKVVESDIKELIRDVGRLEGRHGRPSESGQD